MQEQMDACMKYFIPGHTRQHWSDLDMGCLPPAHFGIAHIFETHSIFPDWRHSHVYNAVTSNDIYFFLVLTSCFDPGFSLNGYMVTFHLYWEGHYLWSLFGVGECRTNTVKILWQLSSFTCEGAHSCIISRTAPD
jgi:hypothetical protein